MFATIKGLDINDSKQILIKTGTLLDEFVQI